MSLVLVTNLRLLYRLLLAITSPAFFIYIQQDKRWAIYAVMPGNVDFQALKSMDRRKLSNVKETVFSLLLVVDRTIPNRDTSYHSSRLAKLAQYRSQNLVPA